MSFNVREIPVTVAEIFSFVTEISVDVRDISVGMISCYAIEISLKTHEISPRNYFLRDTFESSKPFITDPHPFLTNHKA